MLAAKAIMTAQLTGAEMPSSADTPIARNRALLDTAEAVRRETRQVVARVVASRLKSQEMLGGLLPC